MTLRTPRRRISPRTKRRYRAIKDFLRRALGSSSQPDIKINSSIAINVTDLKHKINGLEHQLNEVNRHCQDLACSETSSRKDCPTLVDTEDGTELASVKDQSEISSLKKSSTVETKLLYKTSEKLYTKSDASGSSGKVYDDPTSKHTVTSNEMATEKCASNEIKVKKRKNKLDARIKVADGSQPNLRKHKTQSVYENFVSNVETSSYHSLIEPRISHGCSTAAPYLEKKHKHREYTEPLPTNKVRVKKYKDQTRRNSPENFVNREPKYKHKIKPSRDLDQDFIAEIIKRQYRPVKMFGKRESGMSQISAPVCRDHEFTIRDDILEGSELCSCCIDERKKRQYRYEHQVKDKRSVCDTRLYSSKKHMRHRLQQNDVYPKYNDIYNDSEQYDLIPVKEKSSPKSRRRMFEDPTITYNYYKEVPPSPRTQRPRLNLKASNIDTEFEDYMMKRKEFKRRNYSPYRHKKYLEDIESAESLDMMEYYKAKYKSDFNKKNKTEKHVQYESGIVNSLASPRYRNEQNNITNDNPLNKTQDSDTSGDKTDKALSEIKDILQSFLQEIKKETSGSQCGNSDIMTAKGGEKCLNEFRPSSTKLNTSMMPEGGLGVNSFGIPQNNMPSPFMSPFNNPCCYPILPVCPMNCMQSGLLLPTPSCTCNCANRPKDGVQSDQQLSNDSNGTKTCTETEQLIKEIYKVIAQNPNRDLQNDYKKRKEEISPRGTVPEKKLTSRSAGESLRHSKHDAEVATHKVKCHSRSCEAIGSREISDTYYSRTNPTYSDTMIERLSLEATEASSETETSSRVTDDKKFIKQNRIAKVLRSFGLFKKKKDVIEEVSESESTVEVSIEAKPPPFRQEITDYAMHSQEYYQRPPIPTHYNHYHASSMDYRHSYETPPHCHHHVCTAHTSPRSSSMYESNDNHRSHRCRPGSPYRSPRPHPSAPPYPNPYDHNHHHSQPQVPLCLKEIEVKSIATQSDRKLPFFWKLGRKMQAPVTIQRIDENAAKNTFTQTQTAEKVKPKLLPTSKLANINWKALQAKVNEIDQPNTFSFKTQKKLAEGDIKMRNAMLKKLFYKKNPFSPRNIIVRTILGKDKSSYGEPPMIYRPKMFL